MISRRSNIIAERYVDFLCNYCLNENIWCYLPSVVDKSFTHKDQSLGCTFYQINLPHQQQYTNIEMYNIFNPLILTLLDRFDIKNDVTVLRARLGLIYNQGEQVTNTPHVDFDYSTSPYLLEHQNILYYFNTTNADTIIYNEKSHNIINTIDYIKQSPVLSVRENIECKRNTAVLFDGTYFHSSTTPTDSQWRLVLNLNIK